MNHYCSYSHFFTAWMSQMIFSKLVLLRCRPTYIFFKLTGSELRCFMFHSSSKQLSLREYQFYIQNQDSIICLYAHKSDFHKYELGMNSMFYFYSKFIPLPTLNHTRSFFLFSFSSLNRKEFVIPKNNQY